MRTDINGKRCEKETFDINSKKTSRGLISSLFVVLIRQEIKHIGHANMSKINDKHFVFLNVCQISRL